MEKLMYSVWKPDALSETEFRDDLLQNLAPQLLASGVLGLRISVVDDAVAPAAAYRIEATQPPISGLISMWLHSSVYRHTQEALIAPHVARFCAYLVTESQALVNERYPVRDGERTHGMNQVVFLQRPARLSEAQWLDIWLGSHTSIAIETQSTFAYRQNVVARVLSPGAPHWDAIVEENFPQPAINNRLAFYDAGDDKALYREREARMIESCARFIDFDAIDCIPTSEYCLKS